MINLYSLSQSEIAEYCIFPEETIKTLGKNYDFAFSKEEKIVIVLNKKYFRELLEDSRIIAGRRLEELYGHPAVKQWPMYLDGSEHAQSREYFSVYIKKINECLRDDLLVKRVWDLISHDNVKSLDSDLVCRFICNIYEEVFSMQSDKIYNSYFLFANLHQNIMKHNLKEVDEYWEKLRNNFIDIGTDVLSALAFIVSDTVPSITHSVGLILRKRAKSFKNKDLLELLAENPPFQYISRISKEKIQIGQGIINEETRFIFPLVDCLGKEKEYIFGVGEHKCMGKATAYLFVYCILKYAKNIKATYLYEQMIDPSMNIIRSFR